MTNLKRLTAAVLVALLLIVGGTVALAQDNTSTPAENPDVEDVRFIGDPPGNDQTGDWEGEYEYGADD